MSGSKLFRTAMSGFNKTDVLNYIEASSQRNAQSEEQLSETISSLNSKNENLTNENTALVAKAEAAFKEVEAIKSQLAEAQNIAEAKSAEATESASQIVAMKKENECIAQDIYIVTQGIKDRDNEISSLKLKITSLEKQTTELDSQRIRLFEDLKQANLKNEKLLSDSHQYIQKINVLETKNTQNTNTIEDNYISSSEDVVELPIKDLQPTEKNREKTNIGLYTDEILQKARYYDEIKDDLAEIFLKARRDAEHGTEDIRQKSDKIAARLNTYMDGLISQCDAAKNQVARVRTEQRQMFDSVLNQLNSALTELGNVCNSLENVEGMKFSSENLEDVYQRLTRANTNSN